MKEDRKTSLEKYIPLTLFVRFACERCWRPNINIIFWLHCYDRHVVSCSPDVGVHSIGAFRGPPRSGVAFLTTSGLYSLGVCWQLLRGVFRVPPRSGVAFPTTSGLYCLEFDWQLLRGVSEWPLGRVWPSLPHLVSTVWKSAGTASGGFRVPPRSGVAFPTTSRLYPLGVCWQLLLYPKLNWVE